MNKIRLMVVDDHEMIRAGLKAFISQNKDLDVIAEADCVSRAVRVYKSFKPDVVLMDIQLPGESGIEGCMEICSMDPKAKVLMLTSYSDDDLVVSSIMAGAKGYVSKVIGSQELIKAIYAVYEGGAFLGPDITNKVLLRMKEFTRFESEEDNLNNQEKRILTLLAEGKTNRQIALDLCLSEKTVKNYVSSILGKLDLRNRAEAAAYAVRMNLNKQQFTISGTK